MVFIGAPLLGETAMQRYGVLQNNGRISKLPKAKHRRHPGCKRHDQGRGLWGAYAASSARTPCSPGHGKEGGGVTFYIVLHREPNILKEQILNHNRDPGLMCWYSLIKGGLPLQPSPVHALRVVRKE